jgi:hypothetical protein
MGQIKTSTEQALNDQLITLIKIADLAKLYAAADYIRLIKDLEPDPTRHYNQWIAWYMDRHHCDEVKACQPYAKRMNDEK